MAKVAVIMGSDSDFEVVKKCLTALERFDIDYEAEVISAHRNPEKLFQYTSTAEERGIEVIIGAAGKAVLGVYDPERKKYDQQTLEGKMEIVSLNGNLTRMNGEAYVHLHGAVSDATLRVTGGHVLELRISLTAEIFIRTLEVKTDRKKSEEFGINLIENLEKIR